MDEIAVALIFGVRYVLIGARVVVALLLRVRHNRRTQSREARRDYYCLTITLPLADDPLGDGIRRGAIDQR